MRNYLLVLLVALASILYFQKASLSKEVESRIHEAAQKDAHIKSLEYALAQMEQLSKDKDNLIKIFEDRFAEARKMQEDRQVEVAASLSRVAGMVSKNISLSTQLLNYTPQTEDVCAEANAIIDQYLEGLSRESPN